MKELSIEEKAKAYDEAIERAQSLKNKWIDEDGEDVAFMIFPELKESEDERIRKRIIALVNAHGQGLYKDKMLAWIENVDYANKEYWRGYREGKQEILDKYAEIEEQGKQKPSFEIKTPEESLGIDSDTYNKVVDECIYGDKVESNQFTPEQASVLDKRIDKFLEQKPAENKDYSAPLNIEIPFGAKDSELIQETICIPDGCYAFIEGNEIVIKKGEKPTWSEEDERWLDNAIVSCEQCGNTDTADWLKFLKDRYTWKPSNEQMEALLYEVNAWDEDSINGQNLKSLYQNLKKLREE